VCVRVCVSEWVSVTVLVDCDFGRLLDDLRP